ncbi:MAG: CBS domain-containing protein [Candidatus Pacebacteria bacterium]|nr:CBS domain-containing protein [Candidatus Paceibacterota bacterium]
MRVRDVMCKKIVTVSPDTSYEGAAKLMHAEELSVLVVVDANGSLEGILSEKDLFRAIYPDYSEYFINPEAYDDEDEREERVQELRKRSVFEYMTTTVETVGPQTPLMLAGGLMVAHRIHTLPVVEDGKLVGLISREMVFRTILKQKLSL